MKLLRTVLALLLLVCLGLDEPTAQAHPTRHYLNGPHGLTRSTWYDYGSITASGRPVFYGEVAADRDVPFGARMVLPGLGTFVVLDRGGAIVGARVDVYLPYPGYRFVPDWVRGVYWE